MSDAILTAEIRCAAKYSRRHIRWVRGLLATMLIYDPVLWLVVTCLSGESLRRRPEPFTTRWYDKLSANSDWIEPSDEAVSLAVAIVVGAVTLVAGTIAGSATPGLSRGGVALLIISAIPLLVRGAISGTAEFLYLRLFPGFRGRSLRIGHMTWAAPFPLFGGARGIRSLEVKLLEAAGDLGAMNGSGSGELKTLPKYLWQPVDAQLQRAADLCS